MKYIISIFIILLTVVHSARAEEISVKAAVEQQEVFVGESFLLQLQVEGDDAPEPPDLSGLTKFTVTPKGSRQNSSQSITIVNGQMTRVSQHGYIFNYNLVPKEAGSLLIPAIEVRVQGKGYLSQPLEIKVKKPEETSDFKLRLSLAKDSCYVGEPVGLTVTWYVGREVKNFNFNLPLLTDPRFTVRSHPDGAKNQPQNSLLKMTIADQEVVAQKGEAVLDGKKFLTVSFNRVLIAGQAGDLRLPQATVSCKALAGYRQGERRDPFADLFSNDFFGRSNKVYRTIVVPSNEPALKVRPLPEKGQLLDFSGPVGEYSLAVSATPVEVKVGDPITLTIQVVGPFVEDVELVSLKKQLAESDFKVPEEMAPGVTDGLLKSFTQTIRARHAGVREIPALGLPYFNTASGRYEVARSEPLALKVKAAKVLTARDAEGEEVKVGKKEIQVVKGGISYNYEGPDLLVDQGEGGAGYKAAPVWYVLLAGPPLGYLLLLAGRGLAARRYRDPAGLESKKAHGRLHKILADIGRDSSMDQDQAAALLDNALKGYLGAKLRLNPDALIYRDVEPGLLKGNVDLQTLAGLREIMDHCESQQYAGGAVAGHDFQRILKLAADIAARLENEFQ